MRIKKSTAIGVAVLVVVGLIPLLWYRSGFIISNGDNFPAFLNSQKTLISATAMWSPDYLGYASPTPAYTLYNYLGASLGYIGLSVGFTQILIQIFLYMGAGFSMYFLSRTVYPNHTIAPFFAAFFYLFNFFILESRFNLGFAWTYAFLPLILALFVRLLNAAYTGDRKSANIGIVIFALVSVAAFSVASVNPANIALYLFALSAFFFYYLVKYRKNLLPLFYSIGKLLAVSIPINIWWLYPMLNTFIFSPTALASQVSVDSWVWTHARSSFLNLFWFNGSWGWLPEYIQQSTIDYYRSPIVTLLVFVPFAVAAAALLFKGSRARFNAYIMGCVLVFVFLASGLHDPIARWVNDLLYRIPLANMFREPSSKFTLLIIPFLALLIGYTAQSIANAKFYIKPKTLRLTKVLVLLLLAVSFVFASLPIITGFTETKTEQIPFSSYVQIPQYWYDATNWVNQQSGDGKILLTPINDFYQLPYTWGYYGSDQLLERFFEKPIVSTEALDGYVTSGSTAADLIQIRNALRFSNYTEFRALLDLFGIKFIVQRNDVQADFIRNFTYADLNETDSYMRRLQSSDEMRAFFAAQPYLKRVETFGELDIYQYMDAKPSWYALSHSTFQETSIHIRSNVILNETLDFSNEIEVQNWTSPGLANQTEATCIITQENYPYNNGQENMTINFLQAEMQSTNRSWTTIVSPLFSTQSEASYQIKMVFSARNLTNVNVRIAQYSENLTLITNSSVARATGNFDFYNLAYTLQPKNASVKYFRVEIRNLLEPTLTNTRSYLLLDNFAVVGTLSTLHMITSEALYQELTSNNNVSLLSIQNEGPGKTIMTVDASEPFILATSQVLDKFWVAEVNGVKVAPTPTYLGFKGFQINQTGQFSITVEYQPQIWFNYGLTVSLATALLLAVGLVLLNRAALMTLIKGKHGAMQVIG